jgi:uncharacterized RDD family membrane protein YckC
VAGRLLRREGTVTDVDRRDVASWLSGPAQNRTGNYRGQRLALPRSGPGSLAGFGRRLVALLIDWFACLWLTRLLFPTVRPPGSGLVTLSLFAGEVFLFSFLLGSSFGQRLVGIRLLSLTGRPMMPLAIAVRTLLVCLAVPPLIWDQDGRGLHDRWTRGVLLRR